MINSKQINMSIPPKTRYSDSELEEFRIIVEDKLTEVREQLALIESQFNALVESPEAKLTSVDDSIPAGTNESIHEQATRAKKYMQHLEYALMRIQNKTYGICRETNQLISKARLRAVPHATLSIEAKNKR